jgi:hypothetical protein
MRFPTKRVIDTYKIINGVNDFYSVGGYKINLMGGGNHEV